MAEELRAHTACTPKEGTKDRSAAGYGAEKKMDGISRLSRGSWVPGRYLDPPPPVTLRFASAGAFLASSQLLVRARWLWWDREKRLDLDSTTPSVLSRGRRGGSHWERLRMLHILEWESRHGCVGTILQRCGSWKGTEGEERDSGAFARSSLAPSTAVFRSLRNTDT
jgi:hypothetical protein